MKYKLFSKRGLALIVSLMMCLSAMSTTAWAGNFKDLQDLINNAGEDGKVVLDQNYTYGETADVENENTHISITDKIDLNLNGWTITGSGNDSVIKVETGGDLTLRDEKADAPETAETDSDEEPEKVGAITGGGGDKGAGIQVNGGSLTMEGGSITGNTANKTGGGVYVTDGGIFTMKDGDISGNTTTTKSGAGSDVGGAGIFVENGNVTLEGGSIQNNTSAASGGGVFVKGSSSSFTMNGGEISTNTADRDGEGGGIYGKNNAVITMNGGKITDNTANSSWGGGGVRVYGSNFTMTGGEITGNHADKAHGDNRITISTEGDKHATATITGGKISSDAKEHIAAEACQVTENNVITVVNTHNWQTATCTTPKTCAVCGKIDGNPNGHKWESVAAKPATCTEDGHEAGQKCANCDHATGLEPIKAPGHTEAIDRAVAATCEDTGLTEGRHCSVCSVVLVEPQVTPALNHEYESEVTAEPQIGVPGKMTFTCTREGCDDSYTKEIPALEPTEPTEPSEPSEPTEPDDGNTPDVPVLPETPELPDDGPDVPDDVVTIPDEDVPLGGEPAAAPVTIADEAVPLAGLLSLAQLLDELYRHEDRPAVDLPEGFPFASHEYAPAICWALDSALVVNTEAEPLDPDELLTVGLLRKVLTNYALLKGQEDFVVELTGEDDDLVLDLGERLTVFYAQLEAAE